MADSTLSDVPAARILSAEDEDRLLTQTVILAFSLTSVVDSAKSDLAAFLTQDEGLSEALTELYMALGPVAKTDDALEISSLDAEIRSEIADRALVLIDRMSTPANMRSAGVRTAEGASDISAGAGPAAGDSRSDLLAFMDLLARLDRSLADLGYTRPDNPELSAFFGAAGPSRAAFDANRVATALTETASNVQMFGREVVHLRAERNRPVIHALASDGLNLLGIAETLMINDGLAASTDVSDQDLSSAFLSLQAALSAAGYQVPERGTVREGLYGDQPDRGSTSDLVRIVEASEVLLNTLGDTAPGINRLLDASRSPGSNRDIARLNIATRLQGMKSSYQNWMDVAQNKRLDSAEILARNLTPLIAMIEIGHRIDSTAMVATESDDFAMFPLAQARAMRRALNQVRSVDTVGLITETIEALTDSTPSELEGPRKALASVGRDGLQDLLKYASLAMGLNDAVQMRDDELVTFMSARNARQSGLAADIKAIARRSDLAPLGEMADQIILSGTYNRLSDLAGHEARSLVVQPSASIEQYYEDLRSQAAPDLSTLDDMDDRDEEVLRNDGKIFVAVGRVNDPGHPKADKSGHRTVGKWVNLQMSSAEFDALHPAIQAQTHPFMATRSNPHFAGLDTVQTGSPSYDGKTRLYRQKKMITYLRDALAAEEKAYRDRILLKSVRPAAETRPAAKTRTPYLRTELLRLSGRVIVAASLEEAKAVRMVSEELIEKQRARQQAARTAIPKGSEVICASFSRADIMQFVREAGSEVDLAFIQTGTYGLELVHPQGRSNPVAGTLETGAVSLEGKPERTRLSPALTIGDLKTRLRETKGEDLVAVTIVNQRVQLIDPPKQAERPETGKRVSSMLL